MASPLRSLQCLVTCVAALIFFRSSLLYADSFTVQDWGLNVSVYGGSFDIAAASFETPQNPFVDQHAVTLPSNPATFAAAQYDISWLMDYGDFNISSQLAAQDGHSVRSQASGVIYLQSDADLAFNIDALLNYDLPTWGVASYLSFTVWDVTAAQYAYRKSVGDDTFLGAPASGALSIASDFALPAGHQFRIQYQLILDTFGFSSGLATGDGHVNFTITPEPASLAMLAPLPLTLRRRHAGRERGQRA
jgi:hypothetical protein